VDFTIFFSSETCLVVAIVDEKERNNKLLWSFLYF
jgi:hypothetical protein